MSENRKGFSRFSLIAFYSLSFIAVIIYALIVIAGTRIKASDSFKPFNYDSAVAEAKREVARVKGALKNPADTLLAPGKNITVVGDKYHPSEIHDSLFSFRISYDSVKMNDEYWYHSIKSIAVYRIADQKKIQTVAPPEPFDVPTFLPAFEAEDINFDGYTDFRAMSFFMTRGQTFYDFWLYDPAKGKFEASTALGELWDVAFDHEAKTVTSNQRLAGGPFEGVNEVYAWENGKLVLQHKEECQQNPFGGEDGDLIMTKRIDGKLVSRSKHYDTIPFTPTGRVIFDWEQMK